MVQNSPMKRFKPIHGVFVVLLFVGAVLVADMALEGRFRGSGFERVRPEQGEVKIGIADLYVRLARSERFRTRSP